MTGESRDSLHAAYADAGVDYEVLDWAKRIALSAAAGTSGHAAALGARALDASRGEPAFVLELLGRHLAIVCEGLGTKSIVARQYAELTGEERFDAIGYDAVAAIVNDLICVGALPLAVNAYFSTGSASWYENRARAGGLVEGWRRACDDARCVWGGGESPSLPGLVSEQDIELAGAAIGVVPEGRAPLYGDALRPGDAIVLVASSGLHANGASLVRRVAERLPEGLLMPVGDSTLGALVLEPSLLYVELVRSLLDEDLPVSYLSHITGHGLIKLMRPLRPLTYRVRSLPPVPPVLDFVARAAELDDREAYSTFNMGSGFAVYVRPSAAERVVEIASGLGLSALVAGEVEEGPRRLVVEPLDLVYEDEDLQLAPGEDAAP